MSRVTRGTTVAERDDQHLHAGQGYGNPNSAQDLYDREFNGITAGLGDVEKTGRAIVNDNADSPDKYTNEIRDKETSTAKPMAPPVSGKSGTPAKRWQLFTSAKLRGKTSLITVALVLFGGGGVVTIFSSPALAIIQLRQVLTQDLNDQLKSFENRQAYMMRAKLKTTTSGSCGIIKVACRFNTMSDRQVERFTNKGMVIERDMRSSILPNRGRVTSITIPSTDGGAPIRIESAAQLNDMMRNNVTVRTSMQRAENPWFASMTDRTMKTTLRLLGTSKAPRMSGNTDEERERSLDAAIDQGAQQDTRTLTPELDDEGKPTGRNLGPDGMPLSAAEEQALRESAETAEGATKIKPNKIISSIGKGVLITGAVDSACTVSNAIRSTGALAKEKVKIQGAQMVMPSLLVPADQISAGQGDEGVATTVGNKINNIGGEVKEEEVVDESKIFNANTANAPPMKKTNDNTMTAFDSEGVKAALHGDVITLDSNAARFSLAGGFIGTLSKMNEYIARAITGGNPDPREIAKKCRYVQNPYVRGAALVAGIFAGLGTFGLSTAASVAGSLAISMALPYAISLAANIAAGDMFKGLYGKDFGNGSFVGVAAILGTAAQRRGMKPLSSAEAVAYTKSNQETLARYADTEKIIARSEPFNIYNQYSFVGSLATAVGPTLFQSRSSVATMAVSVTNLLPLTFASLTKSAKAENSIERFQQCQDPSYKAMNIGADVFCNIRYGLSEKELAIDPVENATWMAMSGNVSADDETGEPIDNEQAWNYKKFMEECANRTVGFGEDQEENQGDGTNCLSAANEAVNQRFRIFTMDRSVADYMDGVDEPTASEKGSMGPVSAEGWAYPTTKDAVNTSGYKDPTRLAQGEDHRGVDLVPPSALGKPIYAARDGKVVASGPAQGFGNWIVIEHDVDGKKMSSVYGHMRANDLMVKVGDTVKAGQQISRIGSEGYSTGAHLHFEIWNGNRLECSDDCSIDPTPIIDKAKGNAESNPPNNNEVRA